MNTFCKLWTIVVQNGDKVEGVQILCKIYNQK